MCSAIFQQVADGATVTEVAELYQVSQPGVSRGLQRLEDEVGTPLLMRSGRLLRPTHAGSVFKRHVDTMLHALDDGLAAAEELIDPESGTRAAGLPALAGDLARAGPDRRFREEHPRVRFAFEHSLDALGSSLVAGGRTDLEITARRPRNPDVEWERLVRPAAVPGGTARSRPGRAGRGRARRGGDGGLRHARDRSGSCGRCPTSCAPGRGSCHGWSFEEDDIPVVRGFVAAGLGVAIVPALPAELPPPGGGAERLVRLTDPGAFRDVGLAWSRNRRLLPSAELFRRHVLERPQRGRCRAPHRRSLDGPACVDATGVCGQLLEESGPAGTEPSTHSRASNGHSSMQIPQYMHSDQSMAKRSSTWVVRGRAPGWSAAITSECESMVMHQVGHSRAQTMQDVHAGSISRMDPCRLTSAAAASARRSARLRHLGRLGIGRRLHRGRPTPPGRVPRAAPAAALDRAGRSAPDWLRAHRAQGAGRSPPAPSPPARPAPYAPPAPRPCAAACRRTPGQQQPPRVARRRTPPRTAPPPPARARPRRRTASRMLSSRGAARSQLGRPAAARRPAGRAGAAPARPAACPAARPGPPPRASRRTGTRRPAPPRPSASQSSGATSLTPAPVRPACPARRSGPPAAAGSPGTNTSTGTSWSTPLVTAYESQYGPPDDGAGAEGRPRRALPTPRSAQASTIAATAGASRSVTVPGHHHDDPGPRPDRAGIGHLARPPAPRPRTPGRSRPERC